MKNPIHKDEQNLLFIENNEQQLIEYIGKANDNSLNKLIYFFFIYGRRVRNCSDYIHSDEEDNYINLFKAEKNKFNWKATLLSEIWLGYRKMYFENFLFGILYGSFMSIGVFFIIYYYSNSNALENTDLPIWLTIAIVLAIFIPRITLGLFGNTIYFKSLKKRINKGNNKHDTSKLGAILGFFISSISYLFILIVFTLLSSYACGLFE